MAIKKGSFVRVCEEMLADSGQTIPADSVGEVVRVDRENVYVDFPGGYGLFTCDKADAEGTFEVLPDPKRAPAVKVTKAKRNQTEVQQMNGISETKDMLVRAAVHGGKVAAADEANALLQDIAQKFLGDTYPDAFKTERGKEFAQVLTGLGLHYLATTHPDLIPEAENVAAATEYAVEASARDLLQPFIAGIRPTLGALAGVGATRKAATK